MQAIKQKYWQLESWLAEKKVRFQPLRPASEKHSLSQPLTVNLTSYPPRFDTLLLTLKTLVNQSVRPDALVLWLAENDMALLPEEIISLQERVTFFHIRTCSDTRSYKKLIPALNAYPQHVMVTADDDVNYTREWLAGLVADYQKKPGIIAYRAHQPAIIDGRIGPYSSWEMNTQQRQGVIFPTGIGGVLYPPECFLPEVTEASLFMALAPTADDVWFFFCAKLNGFDARLASQPFNIVNWRSTHDSGLAQDNVQSGQNDVCIDNVVAHFGADRVMSRLVQGQ